MPAATDFVSAERQRVLAEYQRREREVDPHLYSLWQPAEQFARNERKRVAAQLLHRAGIFPTAGDDCLEVGFGSLGWLGDLISWGVPEINVHGIELDSARAERARTILPQADLRIADATAIPWPDDTFKLAIVSTVFSSVLDRGVQSMIAQEITRVLAPGGGLLWYDLAVNNPRNAHVRRLTRGDIRTLFPALGGQLRSVTLAPPLARWLTPKCWPAACLLEAVPCLRTHLIGVLIKTP